MHKMLILADDLTGAADCAAACAHAGTEPVVLLRLPVEQDGSPALPEAAVISIDANTRRLSAAEAAETTAALLQECQMQACQNAGTDEWIFFKKVDSTLRGNVAAELAAALRVRRAQAGACCILMAPAFPRHGRTTRGGLQWVHGRLLEHTDTWINERAIARSNIAEILSEAGMTSGLIDLATVRGGERQLRDCMVQLSRRGDVVICDAEEDDDLRAIANASMGFGALGRNTLWVGSAGLAAHLPEAAGLASGMEGAARPQCESGPTLFVVGSLSSVSRQQARQLAAEDDLTTVSVPHQHLLTSQPSTAGREHALRISAALARGQDVLLLLDAAELCKPEEAEQLTRGLSQLVLPAAALAGALVATGGETARSLLDAWGASRLRLLGEVEAGLPYSVTEGWILAQGRPRTIPILTKAGGFGSPNTLLHCREFLRTFDRKAVHAASPLDALNSEFAESLRLSE